MPRSRQRKSFSPIRILSCFLVLLGQLPLTAAFAIANDPVLSKGFSNFQENNASDLVPIVFVPGTAGSELRYSESSREDDESRRVVDELYWLGRPTLKRNAITRGRLGECGKDLPGTEVKASNALTSILLPVVESQKPIYSSFLAWSRAVFGKRFYVAPYDWRKGANEESANNLDAVIKRALNDSRQTKVILLAHSLGGLVSRDYIVRKGGDKVAALIAVGTPWLGTPKTVRALVWGYNFGAGLAGSKKYEVPVIALPAEYSVLCPNSRCEYYQNISLLQREVVRDLAKHFPGVYQQLPTNEFMTEYGRHYGQDFRGVVWGKNTLAEMEAIYQQSDACLFDLTKAWRQDLLKGDDRGVNNYLIAGFYEPRCKNPEFHRDCHVENRMDMQLPDESQVNESTFPRFSRRALKLGSGIVRALSQYRIFPDHVIAIDSDYEWGDGTSPLLSATAGEYVKGKALVNPQNAKKYLGENTEVVPPVVLGASYAHSAMLDDPQVRTEILKLYKRESLKLGVTLVLAEEVTQVEQLTVKIATEQNGVHNQLETEFTGGIDIKDHDLRESTFFFQRAVILFDDLFVDDKTLVVPKEKATSDPIPAKRRLLTTDLPNMTLVLRNITPRNSARIIKVTSVEVSVNGVVRFESKVPFELVPGSARKTLSLKP